MKSENIVRKLKKEGYNVIYKKWGYWDGIPYVQLEGFDFAIVELVEGRGCLGINLNFIYNEVLNAISIAQWINKKLDETKDDFYNIYKIYSMEDYYKYKKDSYPYNELYHILQRLK